EEVEVTKLQAGNVAQLTECLPGKLKALVLLRVLQTQGMVVHTYPNSQEKRQEDQKFKFIL
ncbi:hypothetical protein ACQP3D_30680, partial [Escherichia coli]